MIIAEGLAAKALVSIKLVPLSYIPVRSFMPPIGAVGEISGAGVARVAPISAPHTPSVQKP